LQASTSLSAPASYWSEATPSCTFTSRALDASHFVSILHKPNTEAD
jgi:hypothetical protein